MDTSGMVGLMGLTFFCNKCVEGFYKFTQDGQLTDDLKNTCKQAIYSFKSLTEPTAIETGSERLALFNTNEEIESFEKVLNPNGDDRLLANLISDLELLVDENGTDSQKKKDIASKLQGFFDSLGDFSFYATKDCLRNSGDLIGT